MSININHKHYLLFFYDFKILFVLSYLLERQSDVCRYFPIVSTPFTMPKELFRTKETKKSCHAKFRMNNLYVIIPLFSSSQTHNLHRMRIHRSLIELSFILYFFLSYFNPQPSSYYTKLNDQMCCC